MAVPATHQPKRFTVQEYLALEEKALDRHEFDNGEVLAMSGGTLNHSQVAANLIGELRARLKGKPCRALDSNMRVRLEEAGKYVYPDVTVVCGPPEFDSADRKKTTIVNPSVIVEVLSDSTEKYDRGRKLDAYMTLASLKEYVLVAQDEPAVETFTRHPDGRWTFRAFRGIEQSVRFESLQIEIPLREVYLNVEFPPPAPPPETFPPVDRTDEKEE